MTANIQVSKKLDDGTILVVGGETADEFTVNLEAMLGSDAAHVLAAFADLVPSAAGGAPAARPQSAVERARATVKEQVPDAEDVPSCNHGPRVWKEGTSAAGKPYKMWKCPSKNRASECKPVWAD